MTGSITEVWYAPVAIGVWAFLTVVSAVFLATFRPRTQRGWTARGIWAMSVALLWAGVRSIWILALSDLPAPRFTSHLQAVLTIGPQVVMAAAVCCWIAEQRGEAWRRRRDARRRRSGQV